MKRSGRSDGTDLSRRALLQGTAAAGLGVVLAPGTSRAEATSVPAAGGTGPGEDLIDLTKTHAFYGEGVAQAGIRTPPQRHIMFMTFDLASDSPGELQILLARWSAAIAQLMKGEPVGQVEPRRASAVGLDTGEALGLEPASLTVTVGLGPRVFTDAFGPPERRPLLMRELRNLPGDAMRPALSGGDLSVQACADDPQVAYHAVRSLARIAKKSGAATTRWSVLGFGRASAGRNQATPRNLFGFKDGTRNVTEDADFQRFVFLDDGPSWQRQGSYQIVRKIRMQIENWDTARGSVQNAVFGRHKVSGAPLGGEREFDTPDFAARDIEGERVIAMNAHIRLSAHENNGGTKILRRPYNYTDGIDPLGQLDAGLLFVSYQNDPAHFETLQARLGASDALNEYVSHIGSAVFFVPPAPREGSYIAAGFFGADA